MRYSFLWIVFVVLFCVTCSRAALDRDSFTALLIDMHTTDGIIMPCSRNMALPVRILIAA